jgi:crotonobetainyl-CoA:carnitine CoA-transferase CaiB-like acyl-CoA transferase
MKDGVRYQYYETSDSHVLFMASEREFWENYCEGIGRKELFEKHPGSKFADHALGNLELRGALREIFRSRSTAEWVEFGVRVNTPIVPVNSAESIVSDPQFQERMSFYPAAEHGTDLMPSPIKLVGAELPTPKKAPDAVEILRETLGYDEARLDALRESGALG